MADPHSTPEALPLSQALAQLEALRASLGDAAVDAALAALHRAHAQTFDLPEAGSPAAPRIRQVSLLFADVAGSTALLGQVDAEDAAKLLRVAVDGFVEDVRAWGGQILNIMGDGIHAGFGVEGLREDEAERAVRAGLQILDRAASHAERVQSEFGVEGFGVRVGIHTGPVLLGGGPEAERSAMGRAVHLAARMEQSAPVGRLRVSHSTWTQVRGLFRSEAQAPIQVKGFEEQLRTWLITGVESDPDASVRRGPEGVSTTMVGRESVLAALTSLMARAVQEGRLQAALVRGDAGVGKTRLRRELLSALSLQDGQPGLLQARAHPSSLLQPYGLLRQLLARWLGIADDMPVAQARTRLVDGLAPWLGEEAASRAPRIGVLLGMDFSADPAVAGMPPSELRVQAFAALRDALFALARHTPLLLVLDDLHWADDASLAFVRSLLAPAEAQLALLLLARPELDERPGALTPAEGFDLEVIELTALGGGDSENLLRALLAPLPEVPASLQTLLLQRAAGNPFFLEALVGMLIDDGVIDTSAHPWRLHAERLQALRVPATLVGVLQARLDALSARALAALQSASIVGPVFWDAALGAVMDDAPAALPALEQRALIAARSSSAFSDTSEHAFAHQLLHDATYETLLKDQRRAGHARVAQWLAERLRGRAGEFLAIAAEHYERAGDSAKALEYWDRAYRDARQRFALNSALAFIDRALAQPALADAKLRFSLLMGRATMLDFVGESKKAQAARADAAAFAEQQNDDAMRAAVLVAEMLRADHEGRPEEARRLAERALEMAGGHQSAAGDAALAHGELAWLALQQADYEEAARQVAAGIVHARVAATLPARLGGFHGYEQQLRMIEMTVLLNQGRYVAALHAIGHMRVEFGGRLSPHDRASLLTRECVALRALGRPGEAVRTAEEGVTIARQSGVLRLLAGALETLAWALLDQGRLDDLAKTLNDLEPVARDSDGGFELPELFELRGRLAAAGGDNDAVATHLRAAVDGFAAQQRQRRAWPSRAALAALELHRGSTESARAAVHGLLQEADAAPGGRRSLQPEALVECFDVLATLGDTAADSLAQDLRRRLDEQLADLPDETARAQLITNVPYWRRAVTLLCPK